MLRRKEIEYKKKIAKLEFALLVDEERYRLVAEYADCGLWEYEIATDTVVQSKKLNGKYADVRQVMEHFGEMMVEKGLVHPDDQFIFESFCQRMKEGEPFITSECRILSEEKEYIWVRYEGKTVFDRDDNPIKVVGRTLNITRDKQEKEALLQRAKIDALTGLLNKAAIKEIVVESINRYSVRAQDEKHALFAIDIDNFKSVNDTYGHLYGDYTIEKIALVLQQVFATSSYVSRIGGDEFAVFSKGYRKREEIENSAETLLEAMRGTTFNKENKVTLSVGIAVYPYDGSTYEELLRKADIALYESKHDGKNSYTVFEEGMEYRNQGL